MLTDILKESARNMLIVAQRMPAQLVFALFRKIDDLLSKLGKYHRSKDTRHSISYFEKENSVIGKISTIDSVIEPQKEGRMHGHFRTCSTNFTMALLC